MRQTLMKIPVVNELARGLKRYVKRTRKDAEARREVRLRRMKFQGVHPLKIVMGASGICDSGWIDTDIEYLNLLIPEHWANYFRKNSIDAMLAEHVWEHLTEEDGARAARQCFEYLKPGGYLRVAVPDGLHPDKTYIESVRPGGTGAGADDHKVLYTHETFAALFERAGFRVELLEYFDSSGEFHFVDWSPEAGTIVRSRRFDDRNAGGTLKYTSIILDGQKDR